MKAIINTSADPFNFGDYEIYNKAISLFGKDEVGIVIKQKKNKTSGDHFELIRCLVPYNIKNVFILPKEQSLANFMKEKNIKYNVCIIRNNDDFEEKIKWNEINKKIFPDLENIYFYTDKKITSSDIRELIKLNELDSIKNYMNIDSFYRYISSKKRRFIVFFGKSCVGKTDYLKSKKFNCFNMDRYLYNGVIDYKRMSEIEKNLKDKIRDPEEFIIYLKYQIDTHFSWEKLFDYFNSKVNIYNDKEIVYLDWSAVWCYYNWIPEKYRGQMDFVEIRTSEEKRIENAKNKKMENELEYLDVLYEKFCFPKFIDKRILI